MQRARRRERCSHLSRRRGRVQGRVRARAARRSAARNQVPHKRHVSVRRRALERRRAARRRRAPAARARRGARAVGEHGRKRARGAGEADEVPRAAPVSPRGLEPKREGQRVRGAGGRVRLVRGEGRGVSS